MQSTGQACTHNSSLVQVSVMTYAILPAVAIAGPATRTANYQKRRGEYLQSGWFGCAMTPSGVGTDATLGSDEDRNPRRPCRRSEEHTSELQSLRHLVCRLLL